MNTHVTATIHKHTDDFALLYLCQVQLGKPLTGVDVILSRVSKLDLYISASGQTYIAAHEDNKYTPSDSCVHPLPLCKFQ